LLVGTQPLDRFGQLLSSLVRIFVPTLLLVLSEETLLLQERVGDELVAQELVEDVELLDQELVECVDDCAHHTDSVSLDGIKHLVGTNCFDLSGLLCRLDEDLSMDVVVVLGHELSELSEQLHNINTLLKLLGWKMRRHEVHLELLFGEYTHMLVCLEVMRRESRHLIEDTA
jgi:hypothetical protein